MDVKEKTRRILELMDRRSAIAPPQTPVDPRLAVVDHLPWRKLFSTFDRKQVQEASKLINILIAAFDFDDFMDLAEEVRTLDNDRLFLYAIYSCVLHREDCRGVVLPPIEECAPHWFFAAETIHEAIQLSIHQPNEDHIVINQKTAENVEPESRLAYYREDIGMNTHHWSWHVIFPVVWDEAATGKKKDRQGEMFYYMHEQMLARYNAERLSSGLNREIALQNFHEELIGYSPHMTSQITGEHLGSRPPGLKMRDLPTLSVQDLEVWKLRIFDAIDNKFVRDAEGNAITLDNEKGIDILGSLVEANYSSINPDFYGSLHNSGHIVIANVHDPDGRFRELPGVMAFSESSARDPVFYKWHTFIDDICFRHKVTLNPYTREELSLEGIKVVSAEVNAKERNILETFIKEELSDLSQAPFLRTNRKIWVQYEHLDHEPFTYTYQIENTTGEVKHVTIRVFLGPKYDEGGNVFNLNEQRRLMIELDKFQQHLAPGMNIFFRRSSESSVTLPRQRRTYRVLKEENLENQVDYCSCGWPEHMLIPRGTRTGMEFNLFVMCTDYTEDNPYEVPTKIACSDAISYCGAKDDKYPDKKPMGFPFDRSISARTMSNFLTNNMTLTEVKVKFLGLIQSATEESVKMYGNV